MLSYGIFLNISSLKFALMLTSIPFFLLYPPLSGFLVLFGGFRNEGLQRLPSFRCSFSFSKLELLVLVISLRFSKRDFLLHILAASPDLSRKRLELRLKRTAECI